MLLQNHGGIAVGSHAACNQARPKGHVSSLDALWDVGSRWAIWGAFEPRGHWAAGRGRSLAVWPPARWAGGGGQAAGGQRGSWNRAPPARAAGGQRSESREKIRGRPGGDAKIKKKSAGILAETQKLKNNQK